jgi:hypothetical protein
MNPFVKTLLVQTAAESLHLCFNGKFSHENAFGASAIDYPTTSDQHTSRRFSIKSWASQGSRGLISDFSIPVSDVYISAENEIFDDSDLNLKFLRRPRKTSRMYLTTIKISLHSLSLIVAFLRIASSNINSKYYKVITSQTPKEIGIVSTLFQWLERHQMENIESVKFVWVI